MHREWEELGYSANVSCSGPVCTSLQRDSGAKEDISRKPQQTNATSIQQHQAGWTVGVTRHDSSLKTYPKVGGVYRVK